MVRQFWERDNVMMDGREMGKRRGIARRVQKGLGHEKGVHVLTIKQVEYFKKQRVVNYQKEQTIKKIEREGGEIVAPQLPTRSS